MLKTWLKKIWAESSNQMKPTSTAIENEPSLIEYSLSYLINQNTVEQIIKDTSLEIFPMLVNSFLEEASLRSSNILKAIEINDFQTLEFEAHTLGSTALAMGATGLGLMARKIEMHCIKGSPESALKHSAEFQALAEQSKIAFSQMLERT